MNRRSFFGLACGGVVAAAVAPFAKPAFATGGPAQLGQGYLIGEASGEYILPISDMAWSANPAWIMRGLFNDAFGATEESEKTFTAMAEYCDELVEVSA